MNNLTVLCCISAVVTGVLCLFVISRLLRSLVGGQSAPASESQSDSIDPTYDDPNIQGHGSFGKRRIFGNIRPTYNDPKIQGQGSFGRVLSGLPGRRSSKSDAGQSGRIDSDSVQGRGSFGRDKKD